MVVKRSTYDAMVAERDEWRARAETWKDRAVEAEVYIDRLESHVPKKKRRAIWASMLAAFWLVLIGLFLGVSVPKAQGPSVLTDYAGCIGQARYQHPVKGNQYQELVNALYACHIYGGDA